MAKASRLPRSLAGECEAMQGKKKGRAEYWMGVVNWDSETSARQVKDALLQKEHPPSTNYETGLPLPRSRFWGVTP
jgi:hypothetical protein